ncbi:hypothetical protein JAAARDRAFT_197038 [Jaapia argillacea MUCL 33604]|uniref:F-box domain-containing protein n=1 Tax=Jaapia argillacea MUCL 33604 TaxID=933084 RepID=A0A067PRL5_9AGAM|nr:hypothetical protein JAAARDRAFT_197038 [Jaapia argillacea MUCL 33604]
MHLSSGEPLFPSLRSLSFSLADRSTHATTAPYMFISHALRQLTLSVEHSSPGDESLNEKRESLSWSDSTFAPFLDAVSAAQKDGGGLEGLSLHIDLDLALSCIGKFRHLRNLYLHTANTSQFFPQLRHLKNLHSLTLYVEEGYSPEEDVGEVAIPSLRVLKLAGKVSSNSAIQIWRLLAIPQLHSLHISPRGTVADCRACWVQATSRFRHLQELRYAALLTELTGGSVLDLTPFFRSLRTMKHMKSLYFELAPDNFMFVDLARSLTDDDCEAMASAFPNLTKLHIAVWDQAHPSPTFRSLVAFARGCSTLESLEIPIDASKLPPIDEVPALSHGLTRLWICSNKSVESAPQTAYLLKHIFPYLQDFHATADTSSDSMRSWELVDECWRDFENIYGLEQVHRDRAVGASSIGPIKLGS